MEIIPLTRLRNRIGGALSHLGRLLLGERGIQAPPSDEVAIGIRSEISNGATRPTRARHWGAVDRQPEPALVNKIRDCFSKASRLALREPLTEGTTGSVLIDPMLNFLGYWPYQREVEKDGARPDYLGVEQNIAIEIKRFDPKYDQISGPSGNKKFETVADQILAYINIFQLSTILYSNGRFWWRVESDETAQRLFALRFDMNLAHNQMLNYGYSKGLDYFVPLFHADAFREGNNLTVPIRMGRYQVIEPRAIWMKDLNQGFGNF